jgi:MFS family permease
MSTVLRNYLQKLRMLNRNVRLYLVSWAIVGFSHFGIMTVLFNLYLLRLGHGPEFVGVVNGAALFVYAIACLPVSVLGKRWSNRTLMITGMAVVALGIGLLLFTESILISWQPGWIIVNYSLFYLGAAIYVVSSTPFIISETIGEERNHAFAMKAALNNLSALIGSLVAGILPGLFAVMLNSSLDESAPYRYPLWIVSALYCVALVALLGTRKKVPTHNETSPFTVENAKVTKQTAPYGIIAMFALIVLLTTSDTSSINSFFNVYLDSSLAVPTIYIGTLSAIKQLLSVLLALSAPLLMERWGKARTIILTFIMRSLSMIPLALIPHWAGAGLGYIISVSMTSITLPAIEIIEQESVPPKWRVMMSGAVNMAFGMSGALMAYMGAFMITNWGYRELFLLTALLVGGGSLLFWGYIRTRQDKAVRIQELDVITIIESHVGADPE